jgi:hypothetical protein
MDPSGLGIYGVDIYRLQDRRPHRAQYSCRDASREGPDLRTHLHSCLKNSDTFHINRYVQSDGDLNDGSVLLIIAARRLQNKVIMA